MDPLVEEYEKAGVGTLVNEITMKAQEWTREFGIKLGLGVTAIWAVSALRFIPI